MRTLGWFVLAAAALAASAVEAQQRPGGSANPLSRLRAGGPGGLDTPGIAAPMEIQGMSGMGMRFLRDARDPGEFVGVGSAADPGDFVGARGGQTAEAIQAAEAAAAQAAPRPIATNDAAAAAINRGAQPARQVNLYTPRLRMDVLAQQVEPAQAAARTTAGLTQIREIPSRRLNSAIEVSLEERTATLRGEVASAAERELAELLVRFEPGISRVQNELEIRAAANP